MSKCFICKSESIKVILDLGESPVANNLEMNLGQSLEAKKYPLKLSKCDSCNHIQIGNIVNQEEIFSDYFYMPSVSKTLTNHLQEISSDINDKFKFDNDSFVVDIGSNDGTFLNSVKPYTNNILGIDPAKNLSDIANKKGIKTINNFFSNSLSKEIKDKYGEADFIVSTNTFAHTPEVKEFVEGLGTLISDQGIIIIEIHYLGSMINDNSFDTIYHEHFSYWSLKNLDELFKDHDLEIFDAKILPVHHGQLRIYLSKNGNYKVKSSFKELLKNEIEEDLIEKKLIRFCNEVKKIKVDILNLFKEVSDSKKIIYGYGAPAKASTLINFIGSENLISVYDKSKLKQGKYIPGTSLEIKDPVEIINDNPDYIFLFAWNFAEEIIKELKENYNYKGKIIIPIPELKVIEIS